MNRLHDRKRTDERDAERTMAPVLAAIEQRWLERAATAGADDDSFSGGIDAWVQEVDTEMRRYKLGS